MSGILAILALDGRPAPLDLASAQLAAIDHRGSQPARQWHDGPVALGWLRASHRALDRTRSSELVPFHPHTGEELLVPGEPVELEIEIWASGTRFRAGEQLVLTLQGRDYIKRPPAEGVPPLQILHEELRNEGAWTVLSGPEHPSALLVPGEPA